MSVCIGPLGDALVISYFVNIVMGFCLFFFTFLDIVAFRPLAHLSFSPNRTDPVPSISFEILRKKIKLRSPPRRVPATKWGSPRDGLNAGNLFTDLKRFHGIRCWSWRHIFRPGKPSPTRCARCRFVSGS